ncbi:MAG TPA: MFS transporter [Chitinophagaceae bacterium]|nr:MFS transporter [Chitinophagaceae bacterium]MCC6634676.1 MFS transporter [Chitinophagaceae bacterium]HMZ46024.1 MFS transporter [Chitinophagaceae bacterium]HNE92728.1 MFS transporter [Chitinophagaceae bacterium]HNF30417.1 MFS transporter [Chitinophagaceae bacterium]
MTNSPKKIINAWAMYDWANSAYNLVITSTMFPAYFEAVTKSNNNEVRFLGRTFVNTSLYNYALGFAFLIVAFISPILSSIADYKGNKKSFLRFFCTIGSIACSGLYFFDKTNVGLGILLMITACVGYWASLVFYNSYLPEIAEEKDRDWVSAKGFSLGYIGSVLLQIICFVLLFKKEWFGISNDSRALQISFLLVGIWWFGFAQKTLNVLPKGIASENRPEKNIFINGFIELKKVWKILKEMPLLKRFLFAFFFYNMGVQTVMLAATLYGKSELAIPINNLIIAILIIQLVAIPGAILLSKLSAIIGNLQTLVLAVIFWICICIAGYYLPKGNINLFYVLAVGVGFIMGGIQSLSRSTYAKLMPQLKETTSFFSFFDVTEKIAIVLGMFGYGFVTELAGGSQRNSVLLLAILFIIGLIILLFTIQFQKKQQYATL